MPAFARNRQQLRKVAAIRHRAASPPRARSAGRFSPGSRHRAPPCRNRDAHPRWRPSRTRPAHPRATPTCPAPGRDSAPEAIRSPSPQAPASARGGLDRPTGRGARQPRSDGAADAREPRAAHPERMDGAARRSANRRVDPGPVASPRRHGRGHGAPGPWNLRAVVDSGLAPDHRRHRAPGPKRWSRPRSRGDTQERGAGDRERPSRASGLSSRATNASSTLTLTGTGGGSTPEPGPRGSIASCSIGWTANRWSRTRWTKWRWNG